MLQQHTSNHIWRLTLRFHLTKYCASFNPYWDRYATIQDQVCNGYVKCVPDQSPSDCIIAFDCYSGDLSTNLLINSDGRHKRHLAIVCMEKTWESLATPMSFSTTRTTQSHPGIYNLSIRSSRRIHSLYKAYWLYGLIDCLNDSFNGGWNETASSCKWS